MSLNTTKPSRTSLSNLLLKLCILSALAAIFLFQPGTGYFQSGTGHSILPSADATCGGGY
jgi:hypothetical protein